MAIAEPANSATNGFSCSREPVAMQRLPAAVNATDCRRVGQRDSQTAATPSPTPAISTLATSSAGQNGAGPNRTSAGYSASDPASPAKRRRAFLLDPWDCREPVSQSKWSGGPPPPPSHFIGCLSELVSLAINRQLT